MAATYQQRILRTEVLAAATGRLVNPADAVALLDLSTFDVDDAELSDTLGAAIQELLAERPYLASGNGSKPTGSADGGAKPPAPVDDDNLTPTQRMRRGYQNSQ